MCSAHVKLCASKLTSKVICPNGSLTPVTCLFLREWTARVKGRCSSPDYTAHVATTWQCRQVTEDSYLFNLITGALKSETKTRALECITGTIKNNTGKVKKESCQTPPQACQYQVYWRQVKFWHCGEVRASSKHIKWHSLEAHSNTGRGRGKGGNQAREEVNIIALH